MPKEQFVIYYREREGKRGKGREREGEGGKERER